MDLSLDLFIPLPLDFVPLCLLLILYKGGWGLGASITPVQVIEKVGLLAVAVPAEFTNCLLSVVCLDVLFQVPAIKECLDIVKAFKNV